MKITGRLFLSPRFKTGRSKFTADGMPAVSGMTVRLFCKPDSVDDQIILQPGTVSIGPETVLFYHTEIENHRVLGMVSGKKVFLQLKNDTASLPRGGDNGPVLEIPYSFSFRESSGSGTLVLTENNLRNIAFILGFRATEIMNETALKAMDRLIYRRLSNPPEGFDEIILSLSDKNLQRLLNSLLHKNIASTDMLAAYIHGLGERGQVLMDNLSRGIRQEVGEKVRAARISSTYRWTDEVNYIINRNILTAIREMDLDIRGLELTDLLRRNYETAVALEHLSSKSLEDWLEELSGRGRIREVINNVDRRTLAAALTFGDAGRITGIFKKIISADGMKMLQEDMDATANLPEGKKHLALVRFLRIVKSMVFAPVVEKLDFVPEVTNSITESGAIDLISDEIGFAKTVYALKNTPKEWLDRVLTGILRDIFEDVIAERIGIKNYGDYRIPECCRDFLKALYILSDEEKI